MKKIIFTLLFLLVFTKTAFAVTPIDFIYINGSNNNDQKGYEHFVKGISKLHPVLKSAIEKDAFTYEHILKNGDYIIPDEPSHYFWGFKSQTDLLAMREKATLLKSISPMFAYAFRNILAGMLHDAIWVRDANNMFPILDELNEQVKKDVSEGKKVILLGYSAGTFITMQYMATKVAYVDVSYWLSHLNLPADIAKIVKQNPKKNTCASALLNSNMIRVTQMGEIKLNPNKEDFKKAYLNIDKQTDYYCVPENSIVGIINYASPIPLFYSDLSNPQYDTNKFLKLMYKHVIEHGMFFLTVNFADDPLGYPNGVNYKNSEISKYLEINFTKEDGFFYDYSNELSWRTFAAAHNSYWKAKERFVKAIIKGYKEGYNFQYNELQK